MAESLIKRIAAKPKAFQILPVELNQEIAHHLADDRDVVHFRASCYAAKDAIDDGKSFWLKRFHKNYDPPIAYDPSSPNYKAKIFNLYKKRSKYLAGSMVHFKIGATKKEEDTLKIVAEVINDSFRGPTWTSRTFSTGQPQLTCNNIEALKEFIHRSDIIENLFRPRPRKSKRASVAEIVEPQYSHLLAAIQLMFAPSILRFKGATYGFEDSQRWAYATIRAGPIFGGFNKLEVNMVWVLHVLNFFKYHICKREENTLYEPFKRLIRAEKPDFWNSSLHNGPADLGVHWKGTYAYLGTNEIEIVRAGNPSGTPLIDHNVDHGDSSIQTMEIDFPKDPAFHWPALFEHHLHSVTEDRPPRTRAQHRTGDDAEFERINQRFQATGYDDEDFEAAGWLNQLPSQHGIPGWKRVTMMKYFEDGHGGWDNNALWAYEGVVLPGGKIMLGRWWSPDTNVPGRDPYTGPFIFWNADPACDRLECDLHDINNS
ncbi:hypothetical protein GTA08_BOTSDO05150 [Botryosphaeria dothidea]|uniref:Uncharacterized protein n=1 Tax=Botryosphaeria dothidea TaxID=55169 RepID=A0A8H4N2I8_9PEZI|nr:hypothetical protein GTA08_BOTSDO05150 [Botryosphaeria dothidea]